MARERVPERHDRDCAERDELDRGDRADGDRRAPPGPDQVVRMLHRPEEIRLRPACSFTPGSDTCGQDTSGGLSPDVGASVTSRTGPVWTGWVSRMCDFPSTAVQFDAAC